MRREGWILPVGSRHLQERLVRVGALRALLDVVGDVRKLGGRGLGRSVQHEVHVAWEELEELRASDLLLTGSVDGLQQPKEPLTLHSYFLRWLRVGRSYLSCSEHLGQFAERDPAGDQLGTQLAARIVDRLVDRVPRDTQISGHEVQRLLVEDVSQ